MGAIVHLWMSGAWLLAAPGLEVRDVNGVVLHAGDVINLECRVVHLLQNTAVVRPTFPGQPMIGLNPLAVRKI